MSSVYLQSKLHEAVKAAKGNRTKAQSLLLQMAKQDDALMASLIEDHLPGIIAYHVENAISGKIMPPAELAKKQAREAAKIIGKERNPFGTELLKNITSGNSEVFGFDSGAPTGKRPKTSKEHIDILKRMAREADDE